MTGFDGAGFDRFVISQFASTPGQIPSRSLTVSRHCLSRACKQRRAIALTLGEHRPYDANHLVGQCDSHDVDVSTRGELIQPGTETGRLLVPALQHRAGSVREQFAQVTVSTLASSRHFEPARCRPSEKPRHDVHLYLVFIGDLTESLIQGVGDRQQS
jgi:hypothetical protein